MHIISKHATKTLACVVSALVTNSEPLLYLSLSTIPQGRSCFVSIDTLFYDRVLVELTAQNSQIPYRPFSFFLYQSRTHVIEGPFALDTISGEYHTYT